MYLAHYGLSEKPFNLTPDPRFVFLSKHHREVFAHLLYGIRQHAGFIEVTGEIGTGKTTVLRALFRELEKDDCRFAYIFNPCLEPVELLQTINREFGLPESKSAATLHAELNAFLLRENTAGRTVVLVIDEAQNLAPLVLEQIRLLSNLETETDKLIQIILVGQPELGVLLSRHELRQLSQRITVRYHLRPMDRDDTAAYIHHRMSVAGWSHRPLFSAEAVRLVFHKTGGNPRLINILCDRSLLVGYVEELSRIDRGQVRRAAIELQREQQRSPFGTLGWLKWVLAGGAALALAFALWVYTAAVSQHLSRPVALPSATVRIDPFRASVLPVLASQERKESATVAFGAVLREWGASPLSGRGSEEMEQLLERAAEQGFASARLSCDLAALRRLNLPVVLELALDNERRYLGICGLSGEVVRLAPHGGGAKVVWSQIAPYWTGRVYLLWRNPLGIAMDVTAQQDAAQIVKLQQLLAEIGRAVPRTGRYDTATSTAIGAFRKSREMATDGRPGLETLVALYQTSGRYAYPQLNQVKDGAP